MKPRFGALVLIAALLLAPPTFADQADPELPGLFERLKNATDEDAAELLAREIWWHWYRTDDAKAVELLDRGQLFLAGKLYPEAEKEFDQLIALKPEFAEGWNRRATVRYLLGDYEGSLADIQRTLELEPRHFGAWSGLGLVLTELDRLEGAIKAYERALALNPFSPAARPSIEILRRMLKDKET